MVSNSNDSILPLVQAGALDVVIELCCVDDSETILSCASIFCNMAAFDKSHEALLESRTIPALFLLSTHVDEESAGAIFALALTLLNLAKCQPTREGLVRAGAMTNIALFAQCGSSSVREVCAETISYLAEAEANVPIMINEGVFEALHAMLTSEVPGVITCCVRAFALIARFPASHSNVLSGNGVRLLRCTAQKAHYRAAPAAIEYLLSVLASLSMSREGRQLLWETIPMPVVIQVAQSHQKDGSTRRRTAKLLCNLSLDGLRCSALIEAGVVCFVSELSVTYKEETLYECASCLCNLSASVSSGKRFGMVKEGAARNLMAICTVRSVNDSTRLVSCQALVNLISKKTLALLCEEGVVRALEMLSGRDIDRPTCARLFFELSQSGEGCRWLATRPMEKLFALITMDEPGDERTKVFCGHAVLNVLRYLPATFTAVPGALDAVKIAAATGSIQCELAACAAVAALSYSNTACRGAMVEKNLAQVVVLIAQSEFRSSVSGAVKALVAMSAFECLRPSMVAAGAVSATCVLALSRRRGVSRADLATILSRLSVGSSPWAASELSTKHLVAAIINIGTTSPKHSSPSPGSLLLSVRSLYELSKHKSLHRTLIEMKGVTFLVATVRGFCSVKGANHIPLLVDCTLALANMCRSPLLFRSLLATGAVEALSELVKNTTIPFSEDAKDEACGFWCALAHTLFQFSATGPSYCQEIGERGIVKPLVSIGQRCTHVVASRYCAAALTNLSTEGTNRMSMAEAGVAQLVTDISLRIRDDATDSYCAVATFNLSTASKIDVAHIGTFLTAQKHPLASKEVNCGKRSASGSLGDEVGESLVQMCLLPPHEDETMCNPFTDEKGIWDAFERLALDMPTTLIMIRYKSGLATPERSGLDIPATPMRRSPTNGSGWSPVRYEVKFGDISFQLPKIE